MLLLPATSPSLSRAGFALLVLLAGALFLAGLGTVGIRRAQEARVAEVAREMLTSGEWLVPELNARVRLQKPPLAYWAVAASYRALGRVNETAARLPSALCALATVLLTAALAGRFFGPRAGFLAGAMLATTRIFLQQARRAETDVPLTLFVTLALFAFDRGFREGRAAWRVIFFIAMGLGFLAKGVPGVVIPLLATIGWLLWERRGRDALRPSFLFGILLTAAVVVPWYAYVYRLHPDAGATFQAETLRRITAEAPHAEPIVYYVYRLPVDTFPWIALLPLAIAALRADPGARRAARLPAAWLVGGLAFLTALVGKQPHYLVPLAPAMAILCAGGMDRAIAGARRPWLTPRSLAVLLAVVAAAELTFVVVAEPRMFARESPRVICSEAGRRIGEAPVVFYRFDDSVCVFYLRRTAEVLPDEAALSRALARQPAAYVLTTPAQVGAAPLRGRPEVYRGQTNGRAIALLAPPGPP